MAPLQPIDRNISPDWPMLAEVARTVAGNWDVGAITEEEVDEDGDLEGAFELPERPASLRNEHHVEDREVFDVTEVETMHVQRRAHRFLPNRYTRCDLESNQFLAPGDSVKVVCAKTLDAVDARGVT